MTAGSLSRIDVILKVEGVFVMSMNREQAWALLTKYNKEPFHLRHAITVEHVMGWYAQQLGYGEEKEFWSLVGLLHDLDFEQWPEEHCEKSQELMRQAGVEERMIHATASHGWGIRVNVKPEHEMEKVLYAADELTGLIGAAALMRPSKSVADMELKSLKKKFKDKKFAAGCSRDVITQGAQELGWELDKLLEMTLKAMQDEETAIESAVAALG
jgi:predicted hydrolase (HD superfamily)